MSPKPPPEVKAEADAITILAHERRASFERVLRELSTWTNDDIEWLAGELTAGNIAPPVVDSDAETCIACGTPTSGRYEGNPMCDGCRPEDDEAEGNDDDEEAASDEPVGGEDD